jgi:hypothetical protein
VAVFVGGCVVFRWSICCMHSHGVWASTAVQEGSSLKVPVNFLMNGGGLSKDEHRQSVLAVWQGVTFDAMSYASQQIECSPAEFHI